MATRFNTAAPDVAKEAAVIQLIHYYRVRGHLIANLDPLNSNEPTSNAELNPETYGLSLWDSEDSLRSRMRQIKKTNPNIELSVGSMIATGTIKPSDGVCSEINSNGHFTFHEFDASKIWRKFKVKSTTIT